MSFNPGGTDYRGAQSSRDRADEGLTRALDRKGRADKQKRIKSETSDMAGLANILRIGAAVATSGASEASGLGAMGSKALQGKRSDGSDYDDQMGDIIGTVAGGYNMMEGLKQKDMSDLKAEDLANYERDIDYAKSFAEGSDERKQGLMAARMRLKRTQDAQDYGDRADTNPFLYKKGRRDVETPTTYFEGDKAEGGVLPDKRDENLVTKAESDGMDEFKKRNEAAMSNRENARERNRQERGKRIADIASMRDSQTEGRLQKMKEDRIMGLPDQGPSPFNTTESESKMAKIKKEKMINDMVDREYNKKIHKRSGDYLQPAFGMEEFEKSGKWEDLRSESALQDEELSNIYGRKALGITDAKSLKEYQDAQSQGKTFSEKEAEKLSRKDKDGSSALDDIAFDTKGKALEKRGGFLRGLDRLLDPKQGKEDEQHLLEYRLRQKKALEAEHGKTGGPMGRGDYEGSLYNPYKNPSRLKELRRAREIALNKGGILAQ